MAGQQGTGKHPHKSSAEPYPHTKDGGRGEGSGSKDQRAHSSSRSSESEGRAESTGAEPGARAIRLRRPEGPRVQGCTRQCASPHENLYAAAQETGEAARSISSVVPSTSWALTVRRAA